MLRVALDPLLSLVFPRECQICHGLVESFDLGVACRQCWSETRIFDGTEALCLKCGAFRGDIEPFPTAACHNCTDHQYDSAKAAGIYEKALAATVLRLKEDPVITNAGKHAYLAGFDRTCIDPATIPMPVPLSRQRRIERGFNQAEVLCRLLKRFRDIRIDTHSLIRRRHTPMHRAAMDRKARADSVRNAFEVTRPNFVKDREILLVDDVFTSGATASSCAEALKKAGASKVSVLTLARAVSV
jgi:ComF family protein